MEKSNLVKLPREVAKAIEYLRSQDWTDYFIVVKSSDSDSNVEQVATINNWLGRTTGDFDTEEEKGTTHLMIALVNGYEVEQTPEDKVREYHDRLVKIGESEISVNGKKLIIAEVAGIKQTLEHLGIQIVGVYEGVFSDEA